jgi:rod shape-determining protein MreD
MSELLRRWGVLAGAFLLAYVLDVIPLPDRLALARPAWLALVVIYWSMALPWRLHLGLVWLLGLLLDVLRRDLLGMHALALTCVAFGIQRYHLQVRAFPVWQQSLLVMSVIAVYEFLLFWAEGATAAQVPPYPWPAILSSGLLWPWVFAALRGLRRRFELT